MHTYIKSYITTYDSCSYSKPLCYLQYDKLVLLPTPSGPWKSISCNFVTDLPRSNGYNSLLVFIDHFTKMCHLVPCLKTTDLTEFARLFLNNVICLHGIPESIISNHGSIFKSHFWKSLASIIDLKHRLSTAFHPQTNDQTNCMNQTIEQYLRIYCNYQQDN